jgi:hypothetical protein
MRDVRSYTPMKKIVLALLLALSVALLVTACDSGKKEEEGANGKPVAGSTSSAPKAETAVQAQAVEEATPPPSPEELDRADRLVAFSNAASMALATGRYAQADVLAAYTKYYLAEWQLAKRPELNTDQDAALARRLTPPVSLFTPEQTQKMAACVQSMNKAIVDMRADYRLLEKYVSDESIQDNGVKGKALAAEILKEHAAFMLPAMPIWRLWRARLPRQKISCCATTRSNGKFRLRNAFSQCLAKLQPCLHPASPTEMR